MTGQDVYKKAMGILDELETDGTISSNTDDAYEYRVIELIDSLQRDLAKIEGIEPNAITSLSTELKISDYTASMVLPYGVAAHLALTDQLDTLFAVFNSKYERGLNKIRTRFEDYVDDMNVMSGF